MQLSVYAVRKYRVPYPLMAAVGVGCVVDYKAMVNIGNYDVNQQNDFGFTALISAAAKSQNDAARFLLAQPNIDVNAETEDGWTALAWAVQNGNVELTKWLLEREDLKNINGTVCEDYYISPYDLRAYAPQRVAGFLRLKVPWQSTSRHRPFPTLLLGMQFHQGRDHDEIIEMLLSKSLHRGISKKHLNFALTMAQCNNHTKLAETIQRFMMGMEIYVVSKFPPMLKPFWKGFAGVCVTRYWALLSSYSIMGIIKLYFNYHQYNDVLMTQTLYYYFKYYKFHKKNII